MEGFGRYRSVRRIGQGGMAEVYEAVATGDGGFERRVAIKRILPSFATDKHRSSFLDEARIASRLHHPNIVGVLDFGLADGLPFQALEFVDGVDVRRLCELTEAAGEQVPVAIALAMCTAVAHALDDAHRAVGDDGHPLGIVHRDVSPGNVLVAWNGDVKLTDFGIAFARDRVEKTEQGVIKGTMAFMAPEQLLGGTVDGRTDVFALACVLHMILTGDSPLTRDGAFVELLAGQPLPLDPKLPDDVRPIIARGTRLQKSERFASAAELAAELGRVLGHRLPRDPTGMIRAWLAHLRPQAPAPPKAGRLDDLLGLDLVDAPTEPRAPRRFTLRPDQAFTVNQRAPAPAGTVPAKAAPPAAAVDDDEAVPDASRGGRRLWWILAGLAVAVTTALVVLPSRSSGGAHGTAGATVPDAGLPPAALAVTVDAALAAEAVDAGGAVVADNHHHHHVPPPQPVGSPPVVAPTPTPTPPADPPQRGYLAIGGDAADRAEILIDGHSFGFAPKRVELPVGPHVVVLAQPGGGKLGPHPVTITGFMTAHAPARWNP